MIVQLIAKIINLILWVIVITVAVTLYKADQNGYFDSWNLAPPNSQTVKPKPNTQSGLIIPKYDSRDYN